MGIKFIGTGSGKTNLDRFHSSFIIKNRNHKCLVDAGDGISRALKIQNENVNEIDSIIITHFHSDHVNGLTSLITQMKLSGRINELKLYVFETQKYDLENFLSFGYIFLSKLDFGVTIIGLDEDVETELDKKFILNVFRNNHVVNKHNIVTELDFVSLSLEFNLDKMKIFYSSDIAGYSDIKKFTANKYEYFILESTHVDIEEIEMFLSKTNSKNILLTHIDDNSEKKLDKICRRNTKLAFDGLVIKN